MSFSERLSGAFPCLRYCNNTPFIVRYSAYRRRHEYIGSWGYHHRHQCCSQGASACAVFSMLMMINWSSCRVFYV